MSASLRAAAIAWLLLAPAAVAADPPYFPPRGAWASVPPQDAGFDPSRLQAAVDFAVAQETRQPRDLALSIALDFASEPYDAIIGPTAPRGEPTGLVIRHGRVVASWGEPGRADMTFSVTKSFLSTVVGLAQARGLIERFDEPVSARVPIPEFSGEPNAAVTWDQLLRQTSGWRGTLWGKPDWADRPSGTDRYAWPTLPVPPPGEAFEYNDVRVNALALAAMHLWKEPLPEVLARELMQPIGASDGWRWHGYDNSWVELGGRRMQSVSGGGHWGGGIFIDAWDLARFGLLWLRRGQWDGRQVMPESWLEYAATPTAQNPQYGVMNWYVNQDRTLLPSAPADAVAHLGNGTNVVYVDPANDLVVVARWIRRDQLDAFVGRLLEALAR